MMMMGFGNYSNGGSSSSASNLSALAPPFTVERSALKPLVDLSEPPLNWLNTQSPTSYGYSFNPPSPPVSSLSNNVTPMTSADSYLYGQNSDAVPTSNIVEVKPYYPSSSLSNNVPSMTSADSYLYGQKSDAIPTSNLVEVKPYYPSSYVSPTRYSYDDYTQSLSGLWDGPRSWDNCKKADQVGENFCSIETNVAGLSNYKGYMDKGDHPSKGINTCEDKSQSIKMLGNEKSAGYVNREQSVPVDYPRESGFGSNAAFPETYSLASSGKQVQSTNYQSPYGSSYEKGVKQYDSAPMESTPIFKSSPGLVIRPPPVTVDSLAPNTGSFNNVEVSSGPGTIDLAGNKFYNTKPCQPLQSAEGKVRFDSSHVSFHLNGDNHSLKDLTWENNDKLNGNLTVAEDSFRPKFGLQASQAIPVGFDLNRGSNEANNCLEDSTESLDHLNPPVDSPCWKGSSISHCSLYGASGANMLFRQYGSDNDLRDVSFHAKSGCGNEVQFSTVMDKPVKDLKFKPFHTLQQSLEEGNLSSGAADAGINTSDDSDGCSYHVPLHATEHVLSSPSSEEAVASAKLTKSHNEELCPKMRADTVINTIHNLSELLLIHFSNGAYDLKNQDVEVLKDVVNNLDKCMSKNLGPVASSEKPSFFEKASLSVTENETVNKPLGMNSSAVDIPSQPDLQHVQEERKHHLVSDSKDEISSDLFSVKGVTAEGDEDKMIQDIKKLLGENFTIEDEETHPQILLYKNLWLEAEAALCSIRYKVRFARLRTEMEIHKSVKAKDSSENATELKKPLQPTISPDAETGIKSLPEDKTSSILAKENSVLDIPIISKSGHPDDVMARYNILKSHEAFSNCIAADLKNQSLDTNKAVKMSFEGTPDKHIWGSSLWSSASSLDDVDASVMARLQILKNRNSSSCTQADVDLGRSVDERKQWPVKNETSQLQSGCPIVEKSTVNKFDLGITQTSRNQGNASNDSSSSEWEHVMEEELPAHNS